MRALVLLSAAAALAGCGEKAQSISQGVRSDAAAYQGTGMAFTASGWKPGDRTSWESQLRTRAQNGQNEYSRAN
ncbi:MAG: lipoprotein [Ramlibacter sp.]